jgi:hypothetical protein
MLPKRSGCLRTSSAVNSFTRRAISRLALPFHPTTLGVLRESIPVAMCCESMKSIAISGDHFGVALPEGSPPWAESAST